MDLDFSIELCDYHQSMNSTDEREQALVFAFFVLSDPLLTTLIAWRVPEGSLASYTRANPP